MCFVCVTVHKCSSRREREREKESESERARVSERASELACVYTFYNTPLFDWM